jgi:hypothetical protein
MIAARTGRLNCRDSPVDLARASRVHYWGRGNLLLFDPRHTTGGPAGRLAGLRAATWPHSTQIEKELTMI